MVAGLIEVGVDALQTQCHGRIGATALVGGRVAGVHLATWTVHIDRLLMQYRGVRGERREKSGRFCQAFGVFCTRKSISHSSEFCLVLRFLLNSPLSELYMPLAVVCLHRCFPCKPTSPPDVAIDERLPDASDEKRKSATQQPSSPQMASSILAANKFQHSRGMDKSNI